MLAYSHVDVFSNRPLAGNGLTVFFDCPDLTGDSLQRITQEMRQFESIFLFATGEPHTVKARIFTMEEELDFAGHPVLGAGCVLHERLPGLQPYEVWSIHLHVGPVRVETWRTENGYAATMEQGPPVFSRPLAAAEAATFVAALNLSQDDVVPTLPLQVVSTGLPYLLVPMRSGLDRARIVVPGFGALLGGIGARFVYVFDVERREGRTWDNDGRIEDIATGSAAGPVGAYLARYGEVRIEEEFVLQQGGFVGRPSEMRITVHGRTEHITSIDVTGAVSMVARGELDGNVVGELRPKHGVT